jgi:hypothetical protein
MRVRRAEKEQPSNCHKYMRNQEWESIFSYTTVLAQRHVPSLRRSQIRRHPQQQPHARDGQSGRQPQDLQQQLIGLHPSPGSGWAEPLHREAEAQRHDEGAKVVQLLAREDGGEWTR